MTVISHYLAFLSHILVLYRRVYHLVGHGDVDSEVPSFLVCGGYLLVQYHISF